MEINSRVFGKIDIDEDKVLTFDKGIIGFDEYKKYTLLFDSEKKGQSGIMWLQSIDEAGLAFPVVDPTHVYENYNPIVEDEWLADIGHFDAEDELYVLCVLTVPSDLTQITANLKAPLIMNTTTKKGCQIIVNNDEYDVRYNIYEYVERIKKGAE